MKVRDEKRRAWRQMGRRGSCMRHSCKGKKKGNELHSPF